MRRKAQFFIITAVLVAGSLSVTLNILEDYSTIDYDEVTASSSPAQFRSIQNNIDSLWYEESWDYERQVFVFERAGRNVEDFPVSIQLDTETLIDEGKMNDDCGDLRVLDDGREIPYQIEEGTCNTVNTTIWFLTDVETNSRSEAVEILYGNDNIQSPSYSTDLQVDKGDESFSNSVITFQADTSLDGTTYGLYEARRLDRPNLVNGPLLFSGNSSQTGFTVVERGPIYATIGFNATHNYTLFSQNNFLRRNGGLTLDENTTFWYGEDNTVLSHWQAGSAGTLHEIEARDEWNGTFSASQIPYVGAVNTTTQEGILFTTNLQQTNTVPDVYSAIGGTDPGVDDRIGFGPSSGTMRIPYLDIGLENTGLPVFKADIRSNPPLAVVRDEEMEGRFIPSAGWEKRIDIAVEERNGSFLDSYPINLSLNIARLELRDDCDDLLVVEGRERQPYLLRDQCDSRTFDEPDGWTARWPLDRGVGRFANDTTKTFDAEGQGASLPQWTAGRFGLGLRFDGQNRLYVDENPPLNLRNNDFTVVMWLRGSMLDQDFNQDVELIGYPDDTPSLHIVNQSGSYVLQGRYRNDDNNLVTVEGTKDIASLDGKWHHVGFVYDQQDQNLSLYVDGRYDTSVTVTEPLEFESNDFKIGEGFDGSLDEIKIYLRDISSDAIRDQAVTETKMTFLTDLDALSTEEDVHVFGGNTGGLDQTYDSSDIPAPTITDIDRRPQAVSVTEPKTYERAIDRFESRILESGGDVELSVTDQCTSISFQGGGFNLEDRVC